MKAQEGVRAVHAAIDAGINLFDSSPYYGRTLSEERLGSALAGKRDRVILATKCGRYDKAAFDFSAGRIAASIDESLRRLQTDYIDIWQAHDIEFGDVRQIIEETLPAMRAVQQSGKARWIGITGLPLGVLQRVAEQAPVDTMISYCHYNLLSDDLNRQLLPFARQHGIGLLNAAAHHMGVLTEAGPPDWHPAAQPVKDVGRQIAALCQAGGVRVEEVALQYCLAHPAVASTLVGMSSEDQVRRNVQAAEGVADPELLSKIAALAAPVKNQVWASGRPENQDR